MYIQVWIIYLTYKAMMRYQNLCKLYEIKIEKWKEETVK